MTDESGLGRAEVLRLLELHREDMRRVDDERSKASNLILLLSAALIGTERIGLASQLSIFVAFLGLLGTVIVVKLYERYTLYKGLYRNAQLRLAKNADDLAVLGVGHQLESKSRLLLLIQHVKLFHIWLVIHISIFLLGLWLALNNG